MAGRALAKVAEEFMAGRAKKGGQTMTDHFVWNQLFAQEIVDEVAEEVAEAADAAEAEVADAKAKKKPAKKKGKS